MKVIDISLFVFLLLLLLNVVISRDKKISDDDDDDDNDFKENKNKEESGEKKKKPLGRQISELENKLKEAGITGDGTKNLFTGKKNDHPKMKEFGENAHKRPTRCQVCRVLMTELATELNNTDSKKETLWMSHRLDENGEEYPTKKIDYSKSEMRILDTMESICHKTREYKAIAGPDFPYLKGVKSMFRSELEGAMKKSGLALKLDAPEDVLDDPTFEVRRLFGYCNTMIEEHEDDIVDWFLNNREVDPLDYVCKERVLRGKDTDCLQASTEVPDFATQPLPSSEPSRIKGEL